MLREDEILALADKYLYSAGKNYDIIAFARAIEDKIKEKMHEIRARSAD